MEKAIADKIITDYMKKIYGFALSKTMDIEKAEELSSDIIFEVYTALLKKDYIANLDGYVFRIASNVYSHFVNEQIRLKQELLQDTDKTTYDDYDNDDTVARLRKEISYLSKLQREIVVMHYFQKLKLVEIAKKLNLSSEAVRWHLFEARNQIKDGFGTSNTPDKESLHQKQENINLINLDRFSMKGILSPFEIDLSLYLQTTFSQNIVYSAYHQAKTTTELAKEFNVAAAFVEDEVSHLVENGLINKMPGNKYLTNIYITDTRDKTQEKRIDELFAQYAEILCEKYVQNLFELPLPLCRERLQPFRIIDTAKMIYTPQNDINFLMWSLVNFVCYQKLNIVDRENDLIKHQVKRKDGGDNIPFASVSNGVVTKYETNFDIISISFVNSVYPYKVWCFNSYFDKRDINDSNVFATLYDFMMGKITKEPQNVDKYIKLIDSELIVSSDSNEAPSSDWQNKDNDYANAVITTYSEKDLIDLFPPITEEIKMIGNDFDKMMFKMNKKNFPKHKQDLCRIKNTNCLRSGKMRIHIIENLFKKGLLKPLKENHKKTVNMIMFIQKK